MYGGDERIEFPNALPLPDPSLFFGLHSQRFSNLKEVVSHLDDPLYEGVAIAAAPLTTSTTNGVTSPHSASEVVQPRLEVQPAPEVVNPILDHTYSLPEAADLKKRVDKLSGAV